MGRLKDEFDKEYKKRGEEFMKAVKEKTNKEVSVEDALKVLQEAEQKKREACWNEILEVAKKHKFVLGISYSHTLSPAAE